MDWRIIPVEPPLLLGHGGLLLLEMFQELAQDLDGVGGVDGGAPGDDVRIDEAARIKNATTICLVRLAWTRAFSGPGWPFGIHCLLCFFVSGV